MHWLIQRGFDSDRYYLQLIETLERMEVSHSFCTVVPFSDSDEGIVLESELPVDVPIYCYGSYSLSKHAVRRGYFPGAFIDSASAMDNLLEKYSDNMLNYDMIVGELQNVNPTADRFFFKPAEDTKAFNAEVTTLEEFNTFKSRVIAAGTEEFSTVYPHTKVVISSVKNIEREFRFFVVWGKVITWSQYKIGDRVVYDSNVDEYIIDYAQRMVDMYKPDHAFVIDIALTEGELKVIEVNSINSSGLYAINLPKLVDAIGQLGYIYQRMHPSRFVSIEGYMEWKVAQ